MGFSEQGPNRAIKRTARRIGCDQIFSRYFLFFKKKPRVAIPCYNGQRNGTFSVIHRLLVFWSSPQHYIIMLLRYRLLRNNVRYAEPVVTSTATNSILHDAFSTPNKIS
jgi:hypothetical protein